MKKKQVKITKENHKWLKQQSAELEITIEELVEQIISDYIKKNE